MGWLTDPQIWASLVTLTALEIVLGIDNLVFIAIVAGRLPPGRQNRARRAGLALAMITRLALLASIVWIIGLTRPVFELFGQPVSWRDIVLIAGGLFLLYKGTREIHQGLEGDRQTADAGSARTSFGGVVAQIMLLDLVFSLDSVITAVGMANTLWVMAAAIVVAVAVMLAASKPLADFVERHPTVKMLALSFLLLIGMTLIADGAGFHVPKGYIYAAIGFSIAVETLNQLAARRRR
jgi:predicted tellurium resistance membrane protein TerC